MKKKLIIGLVIILIAVAIGVYLQKNKKSEITYSPVHVERSTINVTILSTGSVKPKNRLEIKAPVAGRIDEVLIVEGQDVKKGDVLAWMSSTERAAMLDAARSKGDKEFKKWSELYLPTPVLAPIDGTIILKSVEPGQTFTGADAIFTMSDKLTVKAQVDETDIAQIKLNSKAIIVLDAYPDNSIKARVDQLAFDASTTNNVTTYAIDVLPLETPDFMRSGMTANVTFYVNSKENILTIPAEALKVKDGRSFVLIQGPKKEEAPIEVSIKTGISDGRNIEVLEGLSDDSVLMIQDYNIENSKDIGSNPFGPKRPGSSGRKSTGTRGN